MTGRAIAWSLAAVLTAAGALAPSGPARSQQTALEDFDGTYRFSNRATERRGLEAAIDRVADQLNIFIREIARGEIRRRIQPEPSLRIDVRGEERVALGIGDWGPVELELGGRGRRMETPGGDQARITLAFRRGQLIHRELANRGSRTNLLRMSGDRSRLLMNARISSDQLPADIVYRLSFRRVR